MKVLYYPKITFDDFHSLLTNFEESYLTYKKNNKIGYLISAGTAIFTWSFAYRYRLKMATFLLLTVATFGITKCTLDSYYSGQMKKTLNSYADQVARNYPGIKYSKTEYKKSIEITGKNI
jgi:hypothetical protein